MQSISLVVGLGNPGDKYTWTLHNLGFLTLDLFLSRQKAFSGYQEKFKSSVVQLDMDGKNVWFMKPLTFMNLSGEAVGEMVSFYKFEAQQVLVVHDEVDLEAGRLQIKKGGGSAGHNGLESIFQYIGRDFYRLRVGVGKPPQADLSDYLLSKLSKKTIEPMVDQAAQALESIFSMGLEKAKSSINIRPKE